MKHLITLLILIAGTSFSYAQKVTPEEHAQEKLAEMKAQIEAGDPSVSLTVEQEKMILEIHTKKMQDIRALKNDDLEDEEIKEMRKEINQVANKKIFGEILTKEQRLARKAGKEKLG